MEETGYGRIIYFSIPAMPINPRSETRILRILILNARPTSLISVDARLIHDLINILARANVIDLAVKLLIARWNCRTFKHAGNCITQDLYSFILCIKRKKSKRKKSLIYAKKIYFNTISVLIEICTRITH